MELNIVISSFCAGIVQTIVGHPLDTIKTRIQIDNNNIKKVISNIKKNENVLSLYKGGLMPLVGNSILNSFLFTYHYSLNKTKTSCLEYKDIDTCTAKLGRFFKNCRQDKVSGISKRSKI